MKLKLLTTLSVVTTIIVLASNLGIDTKKFFSNLLNLKSFSENTQIKLNRVYGFSVTGGLSGLIHLLLDLDVSNNTENDIICSDLQINAYNDKGEYLGKSNPYASQIVLKGATITTVTAIEAELELSKLIPEVAIPTILQIIQSGGDFTNFKFAQTVKLDIFVKLNGVSINHQTLVDI